MIIEVNKDKENYVITIYDGSYGDKVTVSANENDYGSTISEFLANCVSLSYINRAYPKLLKAISTIEGLMTDKILSYAMIKCFEKGNFSFSVNFDK